MKKIDWDNLGFNVVETRSMYKASCRIGEEWKLGGLIPYGTIELSPAAGVLNYGQGCFEGTKAYRTVKDRVVLFRPEMNAKRMALSTKRLCIPEMNQEFFLNAVKETLKDNIDYVPPYGKGSLYIRPIVWGTSPALGVKPVEVYTFMVFVSPVGPYFKGDIQPLKLKVSNKYHRAAPKGIGNAKAIGNYSASLLPLIEAKNSGFDEVIYLNAILPPVIVSNPVSTNLIFHGEKSDLLKYSLIIFPLYPQHITKSLMPYFEYIFITCHKIGIPPISIIGFGFNCDSSEIRVP